jgi:putative phosphoesterase
MKIAVISDIHGNMDALEAVMEDIKKEECEKVFALGDYAMAGPEPGETINWFFKKQFDENFKIIQGNTDLMIADYNENLYKILREKAPIMAEALKYDAKVLNQIQKDFLKKLPMQLEVDEYGVKILLVHGSPRRNNEDILPGMPLEAVEEIIEGTTEKLILCGHTHVPCGYQTNTNQTVVNVGSVGRPMTPEPKACYAIIDFSDGSFEVRHRFVTYDNVLAAQIMSQRGFVGADRLADLILNPIERHI